MYPPITFAWGCVQPMLLYKKNETIFCNLYNLRRLNLHILPFILHYVSIFTISLVLLDKEEAPSDTKASPLAPWKSYPVLRLPQALPIHSPAYQQHHNMFLKKFQHESLDSQEARFCS